MALRSVLQMGAACPSQAKVMSPAKVVLASSKNRFKAPVHRTTSSCRFGKAAGMLYFDLLTMDPDGSQALIRLLVAWHAVHKRGWHFHIILVSTKRARPWPA